jgi:imidazolonepropionase-like amidohydrolase
VIDGTGAAPGAPASVVIEGGRITAIGTADSAPADGADVIDGQGMFLTPGLVDCHVHLYGNRGAHIFHKHVEATPSVRLIRAAHDAGNVLRAGFTTVRHLGHGDAEQTEALKEAVAYGLVAGPRMQTCGWAISQSGGHGLVAGWPIELVEQLRPRSAFADGPDEIRKLVRHNLGAGAECIKIYATEGMISSPEHRMDLPNYTPAELAAATDEAHRRGARVAAHATGLAGSLAAVRAGVDTLEHGPHAPDDELIDLMVANGTTLVPTLSVFEWAGGEHSELPDFAGRRAAGWVEGRQAMVRAAAAAGVPIAVGSDSGAPPRGGNNAAEIEAIGRAGIAPPQALRAATLDGARALGLGDEVGSVEVGKFADLVLWRRNPLDDLSVFTDRSAIATIVQSSHTRTGVTA